MMLMLVGTSVTMLSWYFILLPSYSPLSSSGPAGRESLITTTFLGVSKRPAGPEKDGMM
jgi:hypothetical protein